MLHPTSTDATTQATTERSPVKPMPRRHKQDIIDSLKGILAVVLMIIVFIAFLMLLVIAETAVLG